jgi:hypothetical protein
MGRNRVAAIFLILAATLVQPAAPALACNPLPVTQAERFDHAAAVFQGRVVGQQRARENVALDATSSAVFQVVHTRFQVERLWKDPSADQRVDHGADLNPDQSPDRRVDARAEFLEVITVLAGCPRTLFEPGREYLVWAYRLTDGRLAGEPDWQGNAPLAPIGPGQADYDFLEQRVREQQPRWPGPNREPSSAPVPPGESL